MTQSKITGISTAIVLLLVALIALPKMDDLATYFLGLRAEIETNDSMAEMEIRMAYYEKLEQKQTRDPASWTDKDERELRLLEQLVHSAK